MTASPVWNPENPIHSIRTLEANKDTIVIEKDAIVIEVKAHRDEMLANALRPTEHQILFDRTIFQVRMAFERQLMASCALTLKIETIKQNLGNIGCDIFLKDWMATLIDPARSLYVSKIPNMSPEILLTLKLAQARLLESFENLRLSMVELVPKVHKLCQILLSHRSDERFRSIIFVQQRHHAESLAQLLEKVQEFEGKVKVGFLVGHGSESKERLQEARGMNAKHQRRIVDAFRAGAINVLVAMTVAEEGLDFPACNLVVRFDPLQTLIGYIQSRERACSAISRYVVMLPRGSKDLAHYEEYRRKEPELLAIYSNRDVEEDSDVDDLEHVRTPR